MPCRRPSRIRSRGSTVATPFLIVRPRSPVPSGIAVVIGPVTGFVGVGPASRAFIAAVATAAVFGHLPQDGHEAGAARLAAEDEVGADDHGRLGRRRASRRRARASRSGRRSVRSDGARSTARRRRRARGRGDVGAAGLGRCEGVGTDARDATRGRRSRRCRPRRSSDEHDGGGEDGDVGWAFMVWAPGAGDQEPSIRPPDRSRVAVRVTIRSQAAGARSAARRPRGSAAVR